MDSYRFRGMRRQLIERLRAEGRYDERVLRVMEVVPRHAFLRDSTFAEHAYVDEPFPIECGQTISQPSTVAWQTTALNVLSRQHVLEIGTGSGYQAAVLSLLGARVFTVERHKPLYLTAKLTFKRLQFDRIRSYYRDGSHGLPELAPFDRILVTAAAPRVPDKLREQLKVGGLLVIPVGAAEGEQRLLRVERAGEDTYVEEDLGGCAFVPFVEGMG